MKCKICNQKSKAIFNAEILNKYVINYFYCNHCGFLQTEEPYWLEEAYSRSINISDTGYIQRNIDLSNKLTILLILFFDRHGKYLDYAGGYGMFTRLMRDIGFDFCWDDLYTENLFAKGFEYSKSQKIDLITTFESFEHFVYPIKEIENMLSISKNIIFSTELLPPMQTIDENWWYFGREHGQHISFYSERTLFFIAQKFDLHYMHVGGLHIFSEKKLPIYAKYLLKFTKFGLHKVLQRKLKSKTWEDYLKVSKHNENTI